MIRGWGSGVLFYAKSFTWYFLCTSIVIFSINNHNAEMSDVIIVCRKSFPREFTGRPCLFPLPSLEERRQ